MRRKFLKTAFFHIWIKGMILFNPFSTGINWKLGTKKERKCNFKQLYLKRFCAFRIKTNIFRKFIQFSSKLGYFLHPLPTCVHGRRFRPLQSPVLLPGACRAQRVNHEAVKDLNFVLFFWFHFKMRRKFLKTAFFHFWTKGILLFNPSAREYFEKLALKKK